MLPFVGGERPDRERMDFVADELAKRTVDELVTLQGPLALELRRHDNRLVMRVVLAHYVHDCVIKSGFYEPGDLCGIHICVSYATP